MGLRFRKSVKICKGVKINFSKSGASLSLGGRGHSVNVGKRGVKSTIGIPGTGLSYTTKTGGNSHKSKAPSRKSSPRLSVALPREIKIHMNDQGTIWITDVYGNTITDQSVLRKIKATEVYKNQLTQLRHQRSVKIDEIVRNSEAENEQFINIHKLSSIVDAQEDYMQRLNTLKPQEYIDTPYNIPAPTESSVYEELEKEAKANVHASIFKVGKLRREYIEERLPNRLAVAKAEWEREASEYFEEQRQEREFAEAEYLAEYEGQKQFLLDLIKGEDYAVSEVFDSWISTCELPVEMDISYDWKQDQGIMLLDVNLPAIEELKDTKMIKTDSGNLKEKKKTQAELRDEYATLVFGLAIFIASNAFNVSPAISKILISGYTYKRNRKGDMSEEYIYSLKFPRKLFEKRDLSLITSKQFCMSVENRCNMTSTSLFKKITPFDASDWND